MSAAAGQSDGLLNWGFWGTGSISATVAEEICAFGGGKLVGVCGRDMQKTEAFAAGNGFQFGSNNVNAILENDRIEAIYIALPHSLHVDAILAALDGGKHVLCEKPLGLTAEDVTRVMAHPRSRSLVVAEGFMVRHHPQWRWISESISTGMIGVVRAVQMHTALPRSAPNAPSRLPGEGSFLLDIACYSIHSARTLFGSEPDGVAARLVLAEESDRDIEVHATLEFDAGQAQIFATSRLAPARRIHVLGERGAMEIFNPVHPDPDGNATVRVTTKDGVVEKIFARAPQYALQFQDFERAVKEGGQPLVGLDDALGNARVIDAIRASGGKQVGLTHSR